MCAATFLNSQFSILKVEYQSLSIFRKFIDLLRQSHVTLRATDRCPPHRRAARLRLVEHARAPIGPSPPAADLRFDASGFPGGWRRSYTPPPRVPLRASRPRGLRAADVRRACCVPAPR